MATTSEALKWAKKNNKFKNFVKPDTKVKDLTTAKKGILMNAYKKTLAEEPPKKMTPAQERAKDNRESFERDFKVGDKVYFQSGKNEKAKVTAGTIEGFTDKGVVMKAEKGEVTRTSVTKPNFKVSYRWKPTGGTMKKVVSWSRTKGAESYNGKSVSVGTVGG
tara:strand:- start:815 stop:1303 length:489 start_codon:yes stop_codon:yes gene_type:complete